MTDREIIAKFTSLLSAGLSLEQATRIAEPAKLSEQFHEQYRYLLCICKEAGGPPILALTNLEKIAQQRQENVGRLAISSAVPKATARLVLWLPVGAAVLGQLLGLGSIAVLFQSSLALVAVLLGLLLLVCAQAWSNRILLNATKPQLDELIVLDAMALSLDAGLTAIQARQVSNAKHEEVFSRPISESVRSQVEELQTFSESTGAPIAKLFRNRAETERRQSAIQQLQEIENVSIRLLAPLAILVLPAFVLIAVLPIAIALLSKT